MATLELTDKQREVKELMDREPDISAPEIADRLGISKPTAYQHVKNIEMRERNGGRAKAKRRQRRGRSAPQHIVPPDDDSERLLHEEPGHQNGAMPSLEEHVELERETLAAEVEKERAMAAQLARGVEEKEERLRRIERVREALHASEAQRSSSPA